MEEVGRLSSNRRAISSAGRACWGASMTGDIHFLWPRFLGSGAANEGLKLSTLGLHAATRRT